MSKWTHPLCERCWYQVEPDKEAVRFINPDDEICCRCSAMTSHGIYYRYDPELFQCKGRHDE